MAYVTAQYYINTYYGEAVIPSTDFPKYEARAEDIVDMLTRNRIKEAGIDSFPASISDLIKKAVCSQIEWYVWNGFETASLGADRAGFHVGKVGINNPPYSQSEMGKGYIAPMVYTYLEQTGLLYMGVPVAERWLY